MHTCILRLEAEPVFVGIYIEAFCFAVGNINLFMCVSFGSTPICLLALSPRPLLRTTTHVYSLERQCVMFFIVGSRCP